MSEEDTKIIKLRGLPWNSTAKDILDFLKDCEVADGEKSVHLAISHRDGRPNGEAYVEMASLVDVDKAFEYNKNVLGHRYIESKSGSCFSSNKILTQNLISSSFQRQTRGI